MYFVFQATSLKSRTYLLELGREGRILSLRQFSCQETLISLTEHLSAPTHSSGELIDL